MNYIVVLPCVFFLGSFLGVSLGLLSGFASLGLHITLASTPPGTLAFLVCVSLK